MRTSFHNKMYTTFKLINSVFRDKKHFNVRYKFVVGNVGYLTPSFILKNIDLLLYCTRKILHDIFLSCYTQNEKRTWMMWISFSLQKACSKTLCIWSAAFPWLLCGIMQKSALSGSTSSNLIAGISPHVRRFSVWAFLKTVTTALHSDFLFTTQEKHPLLTCIVLKSLNLCTQTWYAIIASHMHHCPAHYTRDSQTHLNTYYYTRWYIPTTDRLDLIQLSPLHRQNIAPYYATPQTEVWRAWTSGVHEGRWPYLEIAIFIPISYGLR
jgi:hypothetical protein